jgi:hypothetical protein
LNTEPHLLPTKPGNSNLLLRLYYRLADTRIVVVSLLSSIALGGIMAHEVDGGMLTAFQTSFTPDNARIIMREWGMENIEHFRTVFWLDAFFPTIQALFLSSTIARLTAIRGDPGRISLSLFSTPFLAAALDYLENLLLLNLLEHLDTLPSGLILALSIVSTTKMLFIAIAMLAVITLVIGMMNRRLNK